MSLSTPSTSSTDPLLVLSKSGPPTLTPRPLALAPPGTNRDGALESATQALYMRRFDDITTSLSAMAADIVCLQEVWFHPDILGRLSQAMGDAYVRLSRMPHAFARC